ncbi:MAG: hypothetical protein J5691_03635 [Bacilli bacterium]|nr:hypothetical protein [Bacilli bacterium]
MKNLKKLVIASFMLVIAFVAVVSSTYAWFTQGKEATVKDITIGVIDADLSLLISTDGNTWSREVDLDYDGSFTPTTLLTANGIVFEQLNWSDELVPTFGNAVALNEKGEVDQYIAATAYAANTVYYTRTGENTAASPYVFAEADPQPTQDDFNASGLYVENPNYVASGYITFDLYFQISVDSTEAWTNTSINMNISKLQALNPLPANAEANAQRTTNDRAVSSFRLAVADTAGIQTILEDSADDTSKGHYGSGDQFNISNGWLEMLRTSDINENGEYIAKDAEQNPTKYVLTNGDAAQSGDNSKVEKINNGANAYEYTISCANGSTAQYSVDGLTKVFKVTIYVWMEGWDGDCINAASGVDYTFALAFEAKSN